MIIYLVLIILHTLYPPVLTLTSCFDRLYLRNTQQPSAISLFLLPTSHPIAMIFALKLLVHTSHLSHQGIALFLVVVLVVVVVIIIVRKKRDFRADQTMLDYFRFLFRFRLDSVLSWSLDLVLASHLWKSTFRRGVSRSRAGCLCGSDRKLLVTRGYIGVKIIHRLLHFIRLLFHVNHNYFLTMIVVILIALLFRILVIGFTTVERGQVMARVIWGLLLGR